MCIRDRGKKEKYIPFVIEPSLGADRVVLAFLCGAYDEENIGTEEKPDMRTVLHFHPALAPVKIGVLPLSCLLYTSEIKSQAALLRHRKTGARIAVLANDDENKTFNIGFRTPPKDSTGVAHIMEHSVLCGSEKFPAKDPFVAVSYTHLDVYKRQWLG